MAQNGLALQQCLAYLDRVKNLEMQCYQLERLRNNINYQLRQAKHALQMTQEKTLPEIPKNPPFVKGLIQTEMFAVLISVALGAVIGGIEWFTKLHFFNHKSLMFYVSAAIAGIGIVMVIAAFFLQLFVFYLIEQTIQNRCNSM